MAQIAKRLWDKAGKKKIPLTGSFELLPTCNFTCKMCYVRKTQKEVNESGGLLSADYWLQIADDAMELGLLFPLLTGGEPLLREDFREIMSGMLDRGLQVSINSNGSLVDESMAKWLGHHKPVRMNITLYGSGEDSYQRLCGNGEAYEKVCRGVELLKQYQVPVKFNASITRYNVQDLEAMIQYAKSVDSPIEIASYMFPPVRRDLSMIGKNDRLTPEEAALVKVKADYLQNDTKWFYSQIMRYQCFVPVTDEMLQKQSSSEGNEISCRAGRCAFWVDWKGNIGNCGMYYAAGKNLRNCSFKEAWDYIVEQTNQIRYSPVCTNCPNFFLCHACIAMVHNECGDVNGRPEYLCRMNQAAAGYYQEFAKLLKDIPEMSENPGLPEIHECDWEKLI